ncbi:MAG: AMMECR1 domain-containing protein [Myxococcales bacterium]|nr:AMMECR1 domain-containing protein [Myxococcales bacterium]
MIGLKRGALGARYERDRKELLALVLRQGFVRSTPERPLYANGGGPAPWMLDTLQFTLTADGASLAARCLAPLLQSFESRQLATFGTTAVPLLQACVLAGGPSWRGLLIRKERKPHGAFKLVEGDLDRSQPVVLVDDTLATGESVTRAVEALWEEGLDVEGVVCLVRLGAGGVSRLEERGLRVEAVLDLEDDLFPLIPEGASTGPLNPTKWLQWPALGTAAPEGLHPAALARLALEAYLRDGVMLRAPKTMSVKRDARGGVYVSLRSRAEVHDRPARDGYWTFPGEETWPAPEGVVRAAVQTARRFAEDGYGLKGLEQCAVATTTFGPLVESDVGALDNSKTGLVVRSLLRQRVMGGALPNMPGIANTFQQFRHAHTRNAQLFEGEPYVVYQHTVAKDVEPGAEWQSSGVPGRRVPGISEAVLLEVARRARAHVIGVARPSKPLRVPEAVQLFVSLYLDGALAGCAGADLTGAPIDDVLETLAKAVWSDERFSPRRTKGVSIAVGVSVLTKPFKTGVADAEFMSRPFRFGEQCLEVMQGERRALLLPSVPLTHDLTPLQYTYALVDKAGIEDGDLYWTRLDCDSALATSSRVTKLQHGLPPPDAKESFRKRRAKLLKLATAYLKAHHRPRGEYAGTYRPFSDRVDDGLDPARIAFLAWQKSRVGLQREARQDLARLDAERSLPVLSFGLLTRLALGDHGAKVRETALAILEGIDAHGKFDLGPSAHDADFDYAPGQALLALEAALRLGLIEDTYQIVPKALSWSLRRYRLNHSHGAAPWLMQALVAFDRVDDAASIAADTLTFQSKLDGAFLTGQQDDCPGCTSVPPLEGLAAVFRARPSPRLRRALEAGLRFVDSLVCQAKDVPMLPKPERALGGVRQSLVSGQVRQDFVGHLINLLLTLPAKD